MEDIVKEKLINRAIDPISLDSSEKIICQMKKCVCKININGINGTGFFTKIPLYNESIKVLITNNHIINKDDIEKENNFTIKLKNKKEQKLIKIYKNRKNYTNEKLDITFIELKEKDEITDFLELDDEIINNLQLNKEQIEVYNKNYINTSIYILNYLKGEEVMTSFGLINNVKGNNIYHKCNTDHGSSGAQILSLKNNKIIGVHYGSSKNNDFNLGSLIIFAIIEFNNIISEKNNSIEKIKNEIKFISNYPFTETGIHIELPRNDNIFEWKGYLIGPEDTPYKGGIFNFKILFPDNFPKNSPQVIFLNPIYHLNVNHKKQSLEPLGRVCTSIFNYWNGKMSIREVLTKLYTIFYLNNPDSPYGIDRAEELRNNRQLFDKKIEYFTKKYANPISASQIYNGSDWDFTYKMNENNNYINDSINIIFELDGINRLNFQAGKNELAKNVILRYCNYVGIEYKYILCFHKLKRINENNTLEQNNIENNSLIVLINHKDIIFC